MSFICSFFESMTSCCSCKSVALFLLGALLVCYLFKRNPRRAPSRQARSADRSFVRGSGARIECVNPATGERLGECKAYVPEEVRAAVQRARVAQKEWATVDFNERRALLMDIHDWCVENQKEIMMMSVKDSGKTLAEAVLGEVMTTVEKIRWIVHNGEDCIKPESRPVPSMLIPKKAWLEFRPVGIMGVIVPWNYPIHNILSHVVSSIFCGNGVVVKVSEYASFSAERVEQILREIIARRGHNPDLVQVVTGYAETGQVLVDSVDKVLFIGSPLVGKLVMKQASAKLTPVILELGGKDPFIVFDDCNFNHMIDVAIRGAFINCGQNCVSSERFFVQEKMYDKFVDTVTKKMQQIRHGSYLADGSPKDFGSMTMSLQMNIVEGLVNDAQKSGARLICGGHRGRLNANADGERKEGNFDDRQESKDARVHSGYFFEPTILADVTKDMRIANEECFGPVMTIIKFKTEEEVVEMANRCHYGLGASVFSSDYTKAHRVASQIEAGMVTVNDYAGVPTIQSLPFGGVKESGFGVFNGQEGLRSMCHMKSLVSDRFRVPLTAPSFLLYPMSHNAHEIAQAGIRMVYARSWAGSVKAFFEFMKQILSAKKPAAK